MFSWRDFIRADRGRPPIEPPKHHLSPTLSSFWVVAKLTVGVVALVMVVVVVLGKFLGLRNGSAARYLNALSIRINEFYCWNCQTIYIYEKKVRIRDSLHSFLLEDYPDSKLFIVGSSANGFGMKDSNTDMCLVIASSDLLLKQGIIDKLEEIRVCLISSRKFRPGTCKVVYAQVPILRFTDKLSGIKCELNVNNVVGIRNTHLLAMYARVDPRLPPLGVFVKHWAQKMGIHGGSLGKLNSYALLLMVIQYLQCGCSPRVLPNLQARFPEIFDPKRPVAELDMSLQLPWDQLRSANQSSVGELFAGFIAYYANFDFAHQAISIRNGCPIDVNLAIWRLLYNEQDSTRSAFKIFVEEPFDLSNVAYAVRDDAVYEDICEAFMRANKVLQARKSLKLFCEKSSLSTPSRGCPNENKEDGCLLM